VDRQRLVEVVLALVLVLIVLADAWFFSVGPNLFSETYSCTTYEGGLCVPPYIIAQEEFQIAGLVIVLLIVALITIWWRLGRREKSHFSVASRINHGLPMHSRPIKAVQSAQRLY